MIYKIKQYIKFLFKSTNHHGVHSPFVYNLITKCFYDKSYYPAYTQIKNYKKALIINKDTIEVTDLGAGSHVLKKNTRVISQIAKKSGTTYYRAKLLYRLVSYFEYNSILELGTSLGVTNLILLI